MFGLLERIGRAPLLLGTIKAAVAVAFLSVLAVHTLSSGSFDSRTLKQLAAEASRPGNEPATTGAIGRVEPCDSRRR